MKFLGMYWIGMDIIGVDKQAKGKGAVVFKQSKAAILGNSASAPLQRSQPCAVPYCCSSQPISPTLASMCHAQKKTEII